MRKRMRNGMWGMGRMREKLREDTGKRVGKTIWGEDEERNGEGALCTYFPWCTCY